MPKSMRWFLVITIASGGLCGCKSGPAWDWWRIGKAGSPDSSPIARSAGPSLPSELAEQGNASLAGGNLQTPVVESGGDAMAYGGQAPPYSAATNMASSAATNTASQTYPSTGAGYPTTGATSAGSFAGNYQNTGSVDPFSRGTAGSAAGAAPVQNGYYDPNAYGGSSSQTAATPGMTSTDRYAYNPGAYGAASQNGTFAESGTPATSATPWPPQTASSMPSGAGGYDPPGTNGSAYGASYGASPSSVGTTNPSSQTFGGSGYVNASSGGQGRYQSPGMDNNVQVSQAGFGDTTTPSGATAGYTSGLASNAPTSVPAHYRPGGTGDYAGPGSSSEVSVANRQGTDSLAPPTDDATFPNGPSYRYGADSPYADTGIGQRY